MPDIDLGIKYTELAKAFEDIEKRLEQIAQKTEKAQKQLKELGNQTTATAGLGAQAQAVSQLTPKQDTEVKQALKKLNTTVSKKVDEMVDKAQEAVEEHRPTSRTQHVGPYQLPPTQPPTRDVTPTPPAKPTDPAEDMKKLQDANKKLMGLRKEAAVENAAALGQVTTEAEQASKALDHSTIEVKEMTQSVEQAGNAADDAKDSVKKLGQEAEEAAQGVRKLQQQNKKLVVDAPTAQEVKRRAAEAEQVMFSGGAGAGGGGAGAGGQGPTPPQQPPPMPPGQPDIIPDKELSDSKELSAMLEKIRMQQKRLQEGAMKQGIGTPGRGIYNQATAEATKFEKKIVQIQKKSKVPTAVIREANEEFKHLNRNLTEAAIRAKKVGDGTSFMNSTFAKFSIIMSGFAATLFVFQELKRAFAAIVNVGLQFEKTMVRLQREANLSAREMQGLIDLSHQLGMEGVFSPREVGDAVAQLNKIGVPLESATALLKQVSDTEIELGEGTLAFEISKFVNSLQTAITPLTTETGVLTRVMQYTNQAIEEKLVPALESLNKVMGPIIDQIAEPALTRKDRKAEVERLLREGTPEEQQRFFEDYQKRQSEEGAFKKALDLFLEANLGIRDPEERLSPINRKFFDSIEKAYSAFTSTKNASDALNKKIDENTLAVAHNSNVKMDVADTMLVASHGMKSADEAADLAGSSMNGFIARLEALGISVKLTKEEFEELTKRLPQIARYGSNILGRELPGAFEETRERNRQTLIGLGALGASDQEIKFVEQQQKFQENQKRINTTMQDYRKEFQKLGVTSKAYWDNELAVLNNDITLMSQRIGLTKEEVKLLKEKNATIIAGRKAGPRREIEERIFQFTGQDVGSIDAEIKKAKAKAEDAIRLAPDLENEINVALKVELAGLDRQKAQAKLDELRGLLTNYKLPTIDLELMESDELERRITELLGKGINKEVVQQAANAITDGLQENLAAPTIAAYEKMYQATGKLGEDYVEFRLEQIAREKRALERLSMDAVLIKEWEIEQKRLLDIKSLEAGNSISGGISAGMKRLEGQAKTGSKVVSDRFIQAAEGIEAAWDELFFDVMDQKFDSFADAGISALKAIQKALQDLLNDMIKAQIRSAIFSGVGGLFGGGAPGSTISSAGGHVISEPVVGTGLNSGRTYTFAEREPEQVRPIGSDYQSGMGGMSVSVPITVEGEASPAFMNRVREGVEDTVRRIVRDETR